MAYNWFDFVLIAVVALSCVFGLIRGLIREILSLITWIIAVVVAFFFAHDLSASLSQHIHSQTGALITSFILIFLIVWILGMIVNFIIGRLISKLELSWGNHVLGAIFGVVRGMVICLLVVFVITTTKAQIQPWFQNSRLSYKFQQIAEWIQMDVLMIEGKPKVEKEVNRFFKVKPTQPTG